MTDSNLESLGVKLVDQDELETSITKRANEVLIAKDTELDQKRLEKTQKEMAKSKDKIRLLERRLNDSRTKISQRRKIKDDIAWFEQNEVAPLQRDIDDINQRLQLNKEELQNPESDRLAGESEKDFLIRTGKITAFGNETQFSGGGASDHVFLRRPGFDEERKKEVKEEDENEENDPNADADYDYDGIAAEEDELDEGIEEQVGAESGDPGSVRNIDDGDEAVYQARLKKWVEQRRAARGSTDQSPVESGPEWTQPHPSVPDAVLNANFKLPGDIYPSLFDYQKTCVQWLWELYSQKTGGIIGDEMGLGKTIQIISFIAGLHYSGLLEKPVLVVVPATVLNQWVNEFHTWWPPLRCVILHSIGLGMGKAVLSEEQMEAYLEAQDPDTVQKTLKNASSHINAQQIVDHVMANGHVLVTTYVGLRIYSRQILPREWGYVVLDEGHKIRNPDSDISLTCKQIKTYNRIILSGTPIQNNLKELWSLFDFVFPGRLGTLPVFEQQFSIPINMGGYANASNVQVQTGYKCAVVLRDLISPYLLRRLKSDVAKDLPKKNEMVLFVKLTKFQQDMYERFLGSEDLRAILKGKRNMLMGIDTLRKICNHPDLVDRDILSRKRGYAYGLPQKSGKLQVLKNLLQLWQSQGHRTLLFCQTRQMLDILQIFVENLPTADNESFNYLRMDGLTPIAKRQALVDSFNTNLFYHVFLLTTKVGGLGVNLTGADRVIIFDPDWNPSTDIQARERAWRLGQKKDITIYRLMSAGTIEEKIYHRQIFKTFLTNKILKDPKQRRFFKMNDLHDLFTLGDPDEKGTETGDMFSGAEQNFGGEKDRKPTHFHKKHKNDDDFYQVANIMGVSKLDQFEGEKEDEGEDRDENRIMEGIFANSGVHSTLKHDEIMDSSKQELSLVEREASRVANEAARNLRESRKLARKNVIGTPTWTGKFGAAGKFGPKKKKTTLSSSSILSELKQKKGKVQEKTKDEKEVMISQLVEFFNTQNDFFSNSNDVLKKTRLKINMKNEKDVILLRSLLREVCDWDKPRKGWVLKSEFRSNEK